MGKQEFAGKPLPRGKKVADLVAEVIVREAIKGDYQFAKELLNRVEGKTPEIIQAGIMTAQLPAATQELPPEYVAKVITILDSIECSGDYELPGPAAVVSPQAISEANGVPHPEGP